MKLLAAETVVVAFAYMMSAIPVGGIVLAGRMSPTYQLPIGDVCRWWSRCAFLLALWLLAWPVIVRR